MKKLFTFALLSTLITAVTAFAQGGFKGPSMLEATTVEKAKEMRDDAHVVLVGTLTKQLHGDKYEFKDATGTITVEIDEDLWNGQTVTPEDNVEITGEVDKNWFKTKIDADSVKIVVE